MANKKTAAKNAGQLKKRERLHVLTVFIFSLLMLGLFPLLFGAQGYGSITEVKHTWFWILSLAMAGTIGLADAGWWLDGCRTGITLRDRITQLSVSKKISFIFLLCAIVSTLVSPYIVTVNENLESAVLCGSVRGEGLFTFTMYLVIYWVISANGRFSKWMMAALGGSVTVITAVMLIQYTGGNPLGLYPEGYNAGNLRTFYSTLGNVDMIGGFCCLSVAPLFCWFVTTEEKWSFALLLPLFLGILLLLIADVDSGYVGLGAGLLLLSPFLLNTRGRCARFFLGAAAMLLAFAVKDCLSVSWVEDAATASLVWGGMATAAAAGAAALTVVSGVFFLLKRKYGGGEVRRRVTVILTCVMVVIMIAGLAGVYFVGEKLESGTIYEASSIMHGELHDYFGSYRGIIWKKTLPMALSFRDVTVTDPYTGEVFTRVANPITGTGPDTFFYAFQEYAGAEVQEVLGQEIVYDHAHNEFLQTLSNYGILGLLAYLALIFTTAWRAMKVIGRDPLVVVCASAVLCYLLHSFFSFSITIITPLFWLFLGALERQIRIAKEGKLPFEEAV